MSEPLRVSTGTPVVIDSSMVFKWFDTTERGSDVAEQLLDAHGRDEIALVAPAQLPHEVANVMVCRREPFERLAQVAWGLAAADLLIAPVDDVLLVDSLRIAHKEHLALYDAVFIALAARLDAELVTADARQAATTSCRVRFIDG
jgi:predicted nucleic acid-binding protein